MPPQVHGHLAAGPGAQACVHDGLRLHKPGEPRVCLRRGGGQDMGAVRVVRRLLVPKRVRVLGQGDCAPARANRPWGYGVGSRLDVKPLALSYRVSLALNALPTPSHRSSSFRPPKRNAARNAPAPPLCRPRPRRSSPATPTPTAAPPTRSASSRATASTHSASRATRRSLRSIASIGSRPSSCRPLRPSVASRAASEPDWH